jgi:hypothetical protein
VFHMFCKYMSGGTSNASPGTSGALYRIHTRHHSTEMKTSHKNYTESIFSSLLKCANSHMFCQILLEHN